MRLILACLGAAVLTACDDGPPRPAEASSSAAALTRPSAAIPPGTAPRGTSAYLAALAPPGPPATEALLRRGREGHGTFCQPCHGRTGAGDGPVVARGFPAPPAYGGERLRALEPADIVRVITEGRGVMRPLSQTLPIERWAIAHYVKSLQGPSGAPGRPERPRP